MHTSCVPLQCFFLAALVFSVPPRHLLLLGKGSVLSWSFLRLGSKAEGVWACLLADSAAALRESEEAQPPAEVPTPAPAGPPAAAAVSGPSPASSEAERSDTSIKKELTYDQCQELVSNGEALVMVPQLTAAAPSSNVAGGVSTEAIMQELREANRRVSRDLWNFL